MPASVLLLSIVGLSVIQSCPMWKEIAPCTCKKDIKITVSCENMKSYDQIVDKLKGHFTPENKVYLRIANSNLVGLNNRTFKELNMNIENLKLNHNNLGLPLNPKTFEGLTNVRYFSLADNTLDLIPEQLWEKMPNIRTLDLGRTKITNLSASNFVNLPHLESLIIPGNLISLMDSDTVPVQVKKLHLGRNNIVDLNNTLTNLTDLNWLFINSNELDTLENQLPLIAPNLELIHAANNNIEKLPQQIKTYPRLNSLFFQDNLLTSLDGALSKSKQLERVQLEHNHLNTISEHDFDENVQLENLILAFNDLTTLNNSLVNLRKLNFLNVTHNHLTEFSFQEIVGLEELRNIDLSHNKISKLIGPAANLVEWNIKLFELRLDYNQIENLNGAMSGLPQLERLYLSHNLIKTITPDDLIGLDQLTLLDVSFNQLTTLEEMSKTFLPKLSELRASHNYLTILEKDFHGLPVLCNADFEHNQIIALGRDLVAKTRCQIKHGVHEGTWDILKINLQENPILCDAALPEIQAIMEINHTKICGTSQCLPLREQPVTTKPNAFLGYIPEGTPLPSASAPPVNNEPLRIQSMFAKPIPLLNNSIEQKTNDLHPVVDLRLGVYTTDNEQQTTNNNIATIPLEKTEEQSNVINTNNSINKQPTNFTVSLISSKVAEQEASQQHPIIDLNLGEQEIKMLATQIKKLESKIDQLTNQKQLLIDHQLSLFNETTPKPLSENIEEPRKP